MAQKGKNHHIVTNDEIQQFNLMRMKLYERKGRRFVAATDRTGWYLNEDYTLSEQKTEKSIAICVLHTVSKMVFCELNDIPPILNWSNAREYCSKKFLGNGRLPEIHELLMTRNCFRDIFPESGYIWSSTESSEISIKRLWLPYGGIYNSIKNSDRNQVFAFLTINL